jgi:hypothetical protein
MATTQTASSTQPDIPTSRQLHEAERIQDRLGRVVIRPVRNALLVMVISDDPEARWPHVVIALAEDGRPVSSVRPTFARPPMLSDPES